MPRTLYDEDGFPTEDETKAAQAAGFGYGSGKEAAVPLAVSGQPRQDSTEDMDMLSDAMESRSQSRAPSPDLQRDTTTAALSANRSAIASLGFEPRRTAYSDSKSAAGISGLYSSKHDVMWADEPASVVHESIHRGLAKVSPEVRDNPDAQFLINDRGANEGTVRQVMKTMHGDPEAGTIPARDENRREWLFGEGQLSFGRANRNALAAIESAAAKMIARNRPGGPR